MSAWQETDFGRIPKDWDVKKVADIKGEDKRAIAMGPFGSNIKAENFVEYGVPVIRGTNLNYAKYVGGDFVYLTEEKADNLLGSNCKAGDLVFTHRGTIGQVGIIPTGKFPRYVISQSGMKLTVNPELMDSDFLLYFFKSEFGQHQILKYESQVGVPSISNPLTSLKEIVVPVPRPAEQKAIAAVLSSLDDKIDLLHRQNKTLEAMAETLFRQWFVEEAQEDWSEYSLGDFATHLKGNVVPEKTPDKIFHHYSLPAFDAGMRPTVEAGSEILSNKYAVKPWTILVSKLNPRFPRIWPIGDLIESDAICSTEFQVFTPKSENLFGYIYFFLRSDDARDELTMAASGTSGSHQRVRPEDILNIKTNLPSMDLAVQYSVLVMPNIRKMWANNEQIQSLEKIRDTLLPKLMSGEVRVG